VPDISAKLYQCLFVQRLYNKNQGNAVNYASLCIYVCDVVWLICCQESEYRTLHSQLSKEVLLLPAQLHSSVASLIHLSVTHLSYCSSAVQLELVVYIYQRNLSFVHTVYPNTFSFCLIGLLFETYSRFDQVCY